MSGPGRSIAFYYYGCVNWISHYKAVTSKQTNEYVALQKRANELFGPEASKAFSNFPRYTDGVLEGAPQLYVASPFGLWMLSAIRSKVEQILPNHTGDIHIRVPNDLMNAFHAAACQGHLELIDYMLKQSMSSELGEKDIAIVLKEGKGTPEVLDILLEYLRNSGALLLTSSDWFEARTRLAVAAASNLRDKKSLEYLLRTQPGIAITETVMATAAGNGRCGEEVTRLLPENGGGNNVTEEVVIAAASINSNGEK
jgi:hypothetical protein